MGFSAALVHVIGCLYLFFITVVRGDAKDLFFTPGATITRFSVTQIVPAISTGTVGAHAVWPGVENDSGSYVFQSVISDSRGPGQWFFFVEYCCNPNYEAQAIHVNPGDSITSTFTAGSNGAWTDSWTLSPGLGSNSQGASGSTGNTYTGSSIIDKAVLAIEYQSGASWDFGTTQWTSLSITAATSTSFCNKFSNSGGFSVNVQVGSSSTNGGSTTCTYSHVTFS